jgi:hypothetical protein
MLQCNSRVCQTSAVRYDLSWLPCCSPRRLELLQWRHQRQPQPRQQHAVRALACGRLAQWQSLSCCALPAAASSWAGQRLQLASCQCSSSSRRSSSRAKVRATLVATCSSQHLCCSLASPSLTPPDCVHVRTTVLPLPPPRASGSRPWSCLLVPWGSQELPATPQLTEVEEPLPVLGALAGCGLAGPAPATLKALAGGSRYGERPVLPTAAATPFALAAGNLLPPCTPADGRGVAAPPASVGGLMLEQHQQQQDVVQDSRDSPRPPMYGPFSRGATQLPHSRAGTPLPTCKGD